MGFLKSFYETYLTVNLYDALGIDLEINKLILLLAAALCVACLFIERKQSTESLILRKLIRSEAFGEENARTLTELGLAGNRYAAKILSLSSGSIRTVVLRLGETKPTYEEYMAAEKAKKKLTRKERRELENREATADSDSADGDRFYIPESERDRAKRLFERNSSSPLRTALYCLLIVAFAIALVLLMPAILSLANMA